MQKIVTSNPTLTKFLFCIALILCLTHFVNSPMALAGGFLFALLFGHPFLKFNSKAVNWLLKTAVVGLGFGMNLGETLKVGKEGFILTVFSIFTTILLGFLFGKFLKLDRKTTHLISSGTAVCGGSAIAAVAPVIGATEKEMSISLGVIFLLNSVALLLFPPIGKYLNISQFDFGLWSAIAIHDTSSVVGAALAYGDEALKVATTVKLARALWIIPLSLLSMFIFKGKGNKIKIPWFIFLFILAIIINSYLSLPALLTTGITGISKSLLLVVLFLIGAGLSVQKIMEAGWKPMILGIMLWIFISITSLIAILYFS